MIVNFNNTLLNDISLRINIFCMSNKLYVTIKPQLDFLQYEIDNITGVCFNLNTQNALLHQFLKKITLNKYQKTKYTCVCNMCKLQPTSNLLAHFQTHNYKIQVFCTHTCFIENILANIVCKKYKIKKKF